MSNENGIRETAQIEQDGETYLFASPGGDRFVEVTGLPDNERAWSEVEDGVRNGAYQPDIGRRAYPITATKSFLLAAVSANNGDIKFERVKVKL